MCIIPNNTENQYALQMFVKGRGKYGFISSTVFSLFVFRSFLSSEEEYHEGTFTIDFLELLSNESIKTIMIVDVEKDQIFETTLVEFQKNGCPRFHEKLGLQLHLPLSFWRVQNAN